MIKTAIADVRSQGGIALAKATSGIAGTLLPGGTTVHAKLQVPIDLTETSKCSYKENSGTAEAIRKAKLMVIDEVTQGDKFLFETVDRSLRVTRDCDKPFGGITTIVAGDWMQCLPVVKRGGKAEILNRTFKKSKLWKMVKAFNLTQNMRLKNSSDPEERAFNEWLLRVGEGREENHPEFGNADMIEIPEKFKSKTANIKEFCREIFPDLANVIENGLKNHQSDPEWVNYLVERAILCPTNKDCEEVNRACMDMVPGQPMVYRSSDKILNPTKAVQFPTEYLNHVTSSGMPDHVLVLKRGSPIMLLRNMDKKNGHVNGARYVVIDMKPKLIYALGIGESNKGKILLIPRIIFHPKDPEIPLEMERRQFPIRPCFAMTSNKAQGQTLNIVGINLTHEFFGHGQLYVGVSRSTSSKGLKIFKPVTAVYPNHMVNVVYQEVLQ